MGASAGALREGKDPTIWWSDELFPAEELHYQLIYLKPQSAFSKSLPDAEVMAGLRAMRNTVALPKGVRLQFTGELALQHEEMEAAMEGVALAGWLVLVLLLLVMGIGVRSIKIILATFLMLAVGVVWTTAQAMITVGEFNTLSGVYRDVFRPRGRFCAYFSLRFLRQFTRKSSGAFGVGPEHAQRRAGNNPLYGDDIPRLSWVLANGLRGARGSWDHQRLRDGGCLGADLYLPASFLHGEWCAAAPGPCAPQRRPNRSLAFRAPSGGGNGSSPRRGA